MAIDVPSPYPNSPEGNCWRYDAISKRLAGTDGRLSLPQALDLLASVSQPGTQWSAVYSIENGQVNVVMDRQYDQPYTFTLQAMLK